MKNPLYSIGKGLSKGLKVAALSAAGVGLAAAGNHFLGELAPVLVGSIGGPAGMVLGLVLPPLLAGALASLENYRKNRHVTPVELAAIIAAENERLELEGKSKNSERRLNLAAQALEDDAEV